MSAAPPISDRKFKAHLFVAMCHTGREQMQQDPRLFDHLVDAGEQDGWTTSLWRL
jgi:hypothetical protein